MLKNIKKFSSIENLFEFYENEFQVDSKALLNSKLSWALDDNDNMLPKIRFQQDQSTVVKSKNNITFEIQINFIEDLKYHRKTSSRSKELISRACGWKLGCRKLLDLTAGFGVDAIFLAQLGFDVLSLERNPILFIMLNQALDHAKQTQPDNDLWKRLKFQYDDGSNFILKSLNDINYNKQFDVVYYDPMYPHKSKTALPSKEMQFLRSIVGQDEANADVVKLAQRFSKLLTVVKRPILAPLVVNNPSFTLESKLVRFDIYKNKI